MNYQYENFSHLREICQFGVTKVAFFMSSAKYGNTFNVRKNPRTIKLIFNAQLKSICLKKSSSYKKFYLLTILLTEMRKNPSYLMTFFLNRVENDHQIPAVAMKC